MEYTFSWGWFLLGMLVAAAGAALVIFYRQIADAMGSGAVSYDRYKMWGLIGVGIGLMVMMNLHSILLSWFFSMLFSR